MRVKPATFPFPGLEGYALLNSGGGEKLERIGHQVLRRPDPQALWDPRLGKEIWRQADLRFEAESDRGGRWLGSGEREWSLNLVVPGLKEGARVHIRPTPFRHVGLFPEQATNWLWLEEKRQVLATAGVERPRLLNLFGYTGAATVLAAKAGWECTHVDASRASLDWAAANARLSDLPGDAIRWLHEDAAKFVAREARRGNVYHAILVDPPAYGRGPKSEKWLFAEGIADLLAMSLGLLTKNQPAGLVVSAYAVAFSPMLFANMLPTGAEVGELGIPEEDHDSGEFPSCRILPCGFGARWWRD